MSQTAFPGVAANWLDGWVTVQSNGTTLTQRHGFNVIDAPLVGATNPADNPPVTGNDSNDFYFPGASAQVALSPTTGTFTLSVADALFGVLQFTGTLTGNLTIVLPISQGRTWILDFQSVTFAGHTITVQANGNNWGTAITAENVYRVTYTGTKLWGSALSA